MILGLQSRRDKVEELNEQKNDKSSGKPTEEETENVAVDQNRI